MSNRCHSSNGGEYFSLKKGIRIGQEIFQMPNCGHHSFAAEQFLWGVRSQTDVHHDCLAILARWECCIVCSARHGVHHPALLHGLRQIQMQGLMWTSSKSMHEMHWNASFHQKNPRPYPKKYGQEKRWRNLKTFFVLCFHLQLLTDGPGLSQERSCESTAECW